MGQVREGRVARRGHKGVGKIANSFREECWVGGREGGRKVKEHQREGRMEGRFNS